ncbi:MAG: hypothetical protein Ct9H300mP5_3310 [Candidatus Pelagibacterales bacterium]|nr:MAG: hypothetical protein Ct9H300mP5_3310 [Pelagibacterales bacterium]
MKENIKIIENVEWRRGLSDPDKFPVFDVFNENIFLGADSNHGWKMVGVGKLVADELLGKKSSILGNPF